MKSESTYLKAITTLLIILWVYASLSKVLDYESYRREMNNQVFSNTTASILIILIPMLELIAAGLLTFSRTRKIGLIISLLLLTVFTGYIALIIAGYYNRIPCSCGGILKLMSWKAHLVFNLFFIIATMATLFKKTQQVI